MYENLDGRDPRRSSVAGSLPPSYNSTGPSEYNPWHTGSQLIDERTPFNPPFYGAMPNHPMPAKKRTFWGPIILAGLIAFMLGGYCGYGLDGMEHDSVHRRWNREEANREAKRQEWVKEEEEHAVRKEKMHRETMVWEEKIADAVIRWEVARENLQDAQRKWEREKEEHDRYIKDRILRDRQDAESRRHQWEQEEARRRQRWAEEQARHDRELEERERHEREERERMRREITWKNLKPVGRCLRYGTREYTATLTGVPLGFDALEECRQKTVGIRGKHVYPSRCENTGTCGQVTGYWEIDFGEALCTPWWGSFWDKGCDSSHYGTRRYESQLQNLHPGDDWQDMCNTTPAHIDGKEYSGPTSCADWGRKGIFGIWFVDDYRCQ